MVAESAELKVFQQCVSKSRSESAVARLQPVDGWVLGAIVKKPWKQTTVAKVGVCHAAVT